MKTRALGWIVVMLGLAMCQDPGFVKTKKTAEFIYNADKTIRYNGNYLEFSSAEVLDETITRLDAATSKDLIAWEAEFGFQSQMSLFNKAVSDQASIVKKVGEKLMAGKTQAEVMASMVKPNIDVRSVLGGQEHLYSLDPDGFVVGLRISPRYARVVNANGLLKVEGHIFQYNEGSLKVIEDGNPDKIPLLEGTLSDDATTGILVRSASSKVVQGGRYTAYSESYNDLDDLSGYRLFDQLSLNYISTPIYGAMICEGDCQTAPKNPMKRVAATCYCYRAIVGWNYRSNFVAHLKSETSFLWWWESYRAQSLKTWGYIYVNNALFSVPSGTNHNETDIWVTLYDGSPIDVSGSWHNFSFQLQPGDFTRSGWYNGWHGYNRSM